MEEHEHYLNDFSQYDANISRIIPNSDLFFSICLSFIPDGKISLLELGSGTGYASSLILQKNPDLEITGIDKSPDMISIARKKTLLKNMKFIESDITGIRTDNTYDAVISTLTLHHISGEQRLNLMRWIHRVLNPGGLFVCGDVFRADEKWPEKYYRDWWVDYMVSSGLSRDAIADAVHGRDHAWSLIDTVNGFSSKISESGFKKVFIPYIHGMFAIHVAWKDPAE